MLLINLSTPEEGVKMQVNGVDLYMQNQCHGAGSLYVAESCLTWIKEGCDIGFSFQYNDIGVHAVSRDTSNFPHECLYMLLNLQTDETDADDSNSDEEDNSPITEVRCVPNDPSVLDDLFSALNECQLLHPDPEDEISDDEIGYFNDEDNNDLSNLNGSVQDEDMETNQFEDA